MCILRSQHTFGKRLCTCLTLCLLCGLHMNRGFFCAASNEHRLHTHDHEHHGDEHDHDHDHKHDHHHDHDHAEHDHVQTINVYNERLFQKYANGTTMDVNGMRKFLRSMNVYPEPHDDHHHHHHSENSSEEKECLPPEAFFELFPENESLDQSQFEQVLPAILYEAQNGICAHDHGESHRVAFGWKATVSCFGAVLIISLSGLVVVILIPFMSHDSYNIVSQFLIAVSVGALTGDSFVHLIPHALSPHSDHDHGSESGHHDHADAVWKSLIALVGIYLFFLTERLAILCQNHHARLRSRKQRVEQLAQDAITDGAEKSNHANNSIPHVGDTGSVCDEKLCNNRSGIHRNNIKPESQFHKCNENELCNRPPERPMDSTRCVDQLSDNLFNRDQSEQLVGNGYKRILSADMDDGAYDDEEKCKMGLHTGQVNDSNQEPPVQKDLPTLTDTTNNKQVELVSSVQVVQTVDSNWNDDADDNQPPHLYQDKPHGHHYGHSHDLSSIRTVAYTIVVGDGLHNFCDGLAIGAAFAVSLRGGLSTSIAVLCHELPHELGDFIVLIRANMSVKTALFYELISSILCAIGAVVGLYVGRVSSVDSWLFMLTAGMFVYIALVNMMPELATDRLKGSKRYHKPSTLFIWQNLGLLFGFLVMLLIGLYEGHSF